MNLVVDVSFAEDLILDPDATRAAAGIDRLGDFRDRHVREIPSFADLADPDHRRFLISTLRDSVRKRERLWLIPFTAEDLAAWKEWLSADLFHPVGPEQSYYGERVTPIGMIPLHIVEALVDRASNDDIDFLRTALRDVDGLVISTRIYKKLLRRRVGVVKRHRLYRWLTNPRFLAYLVVFVYSALRALPVTFVKEFQGSIAVLWAIDLGTAIPYTWGMLTMVTAPHFRQRFVGLITTVVTFMLPYLYFAYYGSDYPNYVWAIIAVLIGSTFVLEGYKMRMDRRVRRALTWRRKPQKHGVFKRSRRPRRQLR